MLLGRYPTYQWTRNGTAFTTEFNLFFEKDELATDFQKFAFDGSIKTLYPENLDKLTEQMKDEINNYFYYRQIAEETPQKFLRHFHQTIRLGVNRWTKLLDTMDLLKPDDGRFNYDLTEEGNYSNTLNRNETGNTKGTSSAMSNSDATQNTETTATGKETSQSIAYQSDTPENSVDDIDHFMTMANRAGNEGQRDDQSTSKGTNNTTNTTVSENGSDSTMNAQEDGSGKTSLRRYGNIGVMTSAQILVGYRTAQAWDAWQAIFDELEPLFLQVF